MGKTSAQVPPMASEEIFFAFLPLLFPDAFPAFAFGFVGEEALTETRAVSTPGNH